MITLLLSLCMLAAMMQASEAATGARKTKLLDHVTHVEQDFNTEITSVSSEIFFKQLAAMGKIFDQCSMQFPRATPAQQREIAQIVRAGIHALKRMQSRVPDCKKLEISLPDTSNDDIPTAQQLREETNGWGYWPFIAPEAAIPAMSGDKKENEHKGLSSASLEPAPTSASGTSATTAALDKTCVCGRPTLCPPNSWCRFAQDRGGEAPCP